jgi:hypothetical protein
LRNVKMADARERAVKMIQKAGRRSMADSRTQRHQGTKTPRKRRS